MHNWKVGKDEDTINTCRRHIEKEFAQNKEFRAQWKQSNLSKMKLIQVYQEVQDGCNAFHYVIFSFSINIEELS